MDEFSGMVTAINYRNIVLVSSMTQYQNPTNKNTVSVISMIIKFKKTQIEEVFQNMKFFQFILSFN